MFALPSTASRAEARAWYDSMLARGPEAWSNWQRIFPLVTEAGALAGILTRGQMMLQAQEDDQSAPLLNAAAANPISMSTTQTLRQAAMIMADSKHTAFPVVDHEGKFAGILTIADLLTARTLAERRESARERTLKLHWPFRPKPTA